MKLEEILIREQLIKPDECSVLKATFHEKSKRLEISLKFKKALNLKTYQSVQQTIASLFEPLEIQTDTAVC